jgi:hypothetical protein
MSCVYSHLFKPYDGRFHDNITNVLIAFWGGTMGAILSYLYDRLNSQLKTEELIFPMARLLFGGILGAASFLFIQSSVLIKIFYPKIAEGQDPILISYQSVIAVAVFSGILGPLLIKGIRTRAG